jgi:hypothetical protein
MVIYETDTNLFWYCSNATGPVWYPVVTRTQYSVSDSNMGTTTTTFVKDTGCGDIQFTVPAATIVYRLRYTCRPLADANGSRVDLHINDGGASSPTNASTTVAAGNVYLALSGGIGSISTVVENITTFTAGTHTIAAFYARGTGTANVTVDNPSAGKRVLSVEMMPDAN